MSVNLPIMAMEQTLAHLVLLQTVMSVTLLLLFVTNVLMDMSVMERVVANVQLTIVPLVNLMLINNLNVLLVQLNIILSDRMSASDV